MLSLGFALGVSAMWLLMLLATPSECVINKVELRGTLQ